MDGILRTGKDYIKYNDTSGLQTYLKTAERRTVDYQLNFQYVFRDLYYYACKNGTQEMISWFICVYFDYFDVVSRIAMRQTFSYGKYLLAGKKNPRISDDWYEEFVMDAVRWYKSGTHP